MRLIGLSVLILTCLNSSVFAQEVSDMDNLLFNSFTMMEENARLEEAHSPNNRLYDGGGVRRKIQNMDPQYNLAEPNRWCPEGAENCATYEGQELKWLPAKRKSSVNAFAPMSGLHDSMLSAARLDQASRLLSSPNSLYFSTVSMTEPAIASAQFQSLNLAYSEVQNRYLADQNFREQMKANPETGELLMQAYNACINNQMSSAGFVDGNGTPLSWINAQSNCMGGDRNSDLDLAVPFSDISNVKWFRFQYDPNHQLHTLDEYIFDPENAPELEDVVENKIRLTDYLFNQEAVGTAQAEAAIEAGLDPESIYGVFIGLPDFAENFELPEADQIASSWSLGFKYSWKTILGDVEFGMNDFDEDAVSNMIDARRGAYHVTVRKIAPIKGSEWYYKNLVKTAWNNLHSIMLQYCLKGGGTIDGEVQEGWRFNSRLFAAELTGISLRGFQASPAMLQTYANMFIPEERAFGADGIRRKDCSPLLTGDAVDADNPAGASNLAIVMNRPSKITSSQALYFQFSRYIALGQWLGVLINAENVVNSLTVGSFDTSVRRYAKELIYEAAGTRDLEKAYQTNIRQLMNLFN